LAQRAALLLWITAQVTNASGLTGQPEDRNRAWKPDPETRSIVEQPVRAFAPAAVETLNSTVRASAAEPLPPAELGFDARPWAILLPPRQQNDPPRSSLPPTWMLLVAATAVLATVDPRHHRRRTRTGYRRTANPAVTKRKPRPTPWKGESAAVDPLATPKTAH